MGPRLTGSASPSAAMSLAMASTASQSDDAPANAIEKCRVRAGSRPRRRAQFEQRTSTRVVLDLHVRHDGRRQQCEVQVPGLLDGERCAIGFWRPAIDACDSRDEIEPVWIVGQGDQRLRVLGSELLNLSITDEVSYHAGPRDCEAWIELADARHQGVLVRRPPSTVQRRVVVPQRRDVVGVQLQRALVQLLGARRITFPQRRAKRGVPFGKLGVDRQRPVGGRFGAFLRVRRRRRAAVVLPEHQRAREARVGLGVLRIQLYRALEVGDRFAQAVGGPGLLRRATQQIQVVGGGIPSRRW